MPDARDPGPAGKAAKIVLSNARLDRVIGRSEARAVAGTLAADSNVAAGSGAKILFIDVLSCCCLCMSDTAQGTAARDAPSRLSGGVRSGALRHFASMPPATWAPPSRALQAATVLVAFAAFVTAVALPLATYTTVLALFGFAHVASELRYVDHRFGTCIRGCLFGRLATLLALSVLARLSGAAGWVALDLALGLEIALGAALVALTIAHMRRRRWAALAAAAFLAGGAVLAPFETLLTLAIAHNLTPLAFLAEALRGRQRVRALVLASVAFLVLPLLIATGLPFQALANLGLVAPEATLFNGGDLARNLAAYVPDSALYSAWALHAFSASVFAQCMHYVAVIGVLPRLIDGGCRPLFAWPDARRFARYLAVGAAALAVGFALDYGLQRHVYALAALVHAWLELPVFALALGGALPAQARSSA